MFHWKDGWWFSRQENGSVSFEHRVYGTEKNELGELTYTMDAKGNIPPMEWASIVAAVSVHGDNNPYWQAALDFHNGVGMKEGS